MLLCPPPAAIGRPLLERQEAGGWFAAGKTLGVALDLDSGTLRVSVDGGEWAVAFPDGCAPSAAAGGALFPALSGECGASVRCNWGADARRPLKRAPPSGGYMAVGLAGKVLLLLSHRLPFCHRPPLPPTPSPLAACSPVHHPLGRSGERAGAALGRSSWTSATCRGRQAGATPH